MTADSHYDEERLARLLRRLKEPPEAWIEAAKQAPAARREIEGLVDRAQADEAYRKRVLDGLESALRDAGHEPDRRLLAALRAQLVDPGEGSP